MAVEGLRRAAALLVSLLLIGGCSGAPPPENIPRKEPLQIAAAEVEVPPAEEAVEEPAPSAPKVMPGTVPIPTGSLDKEIIRRIVLARVDDIRGCYEKLALVDDPQREGKVAVKFIVGTDGVVTMVAIAETTLDHEPTEECIAGVVREMRFPSPKGGGIVIITYPFRFVSKKDEPAPEPAQQ